MITLPCSCSLSWLLLCSIGEDGGETNAAEANISAKASKLVDRVFDAFRTLGGTTDAPEVGPKSAAASEPAAAEELDVTKNQVAGTVLTARTWYILVSREMILPFIR